MKRRGFISGLAALIAAPALVRAEAIMPVRAWRSATPIADEMEAMAARGEVISGIWRPERGLVFPERARVVFDQAYLHPQRLKRGEAVITVECTTELAVMGSTLHIPNSEGAYGLLVKAPRNV